MSRPAQGTLENTAKAHFTHFIIRTIFQGPIKGVVHLASIILGKPSSHKPWGEVTVWVSDQGKGGGARYWFLRESIASPFRLNCEGCSERTEPMGTGI